MKRYFPPVMFDEPFGTGYFDTRNGKDVLGEVCKAAQVRVGEAEYYGIADAMQREEIHPEVVEKLDAIAEHLSIADGSKG